MNTQPSLLTSACRELIRKASAIATRLEYGQAVTPLIDRFQQWQTVSLNDPSTSRKESGTEAESTDRSRFETPLHQLRLDCDLLADVNRQKIAYQKQRRLLLNAIDTTADGGRLQQTCAVLKSMIDERMSSVESELKETARDRSLPSSAISNRINNLMEDLSSTDIAEESAYRVTRLTVSSDFLLRAESVIRSALVTGLRSDLELISISTDELKTVLSRKMPGIDRSLESLSIPGINESQEIDRICELTRIDSRYHGELPQKNWMDRVSHGRRPVFVIMMTASLVGSAFGIGGGMMVWLLPLMLMMFVAGTIWTFRSFREERASRIDRELIRLRETIRSEMKRLYESVQKEWLNRAVAHLSMLRRCLIQPLDDILVQHQDEWRRRAQAVSQEMNQRRQSIERQIRELELNALEFTKLLQCLPSSESSALCLL